MNEKRALVHSIALFLLPIVVAAFGWSVLTAVLVVVIMLLWRWVISLSTFVKPEKVPPLLLETISISHFAEKVRWNMDAAGIEYVESTAGGTLGAFYTGRTVPRLKMTTGATSGERILQKTRNRPATSSQRPNGWRSNTGWTATARASRFGSTTISSTIAI